MEDGTVPATHHRDGDRVGVWRYSWIWPQPTGWRGSVAGQAADSQSTSFQSPALEGINTDRVGPKQVSQVYQWAKTATAEAGAEFSHLDTLWLSVIWQGKHGPRRKENRVKGLCGAYRITIIRGYGNSIGGLRQTGRQAVRREGGWRWVISFQQFWGNPSRGLYSSGGRWPGEIVAGDSEDFGSSTYFWSRPVRRLPTAREAGVWLRRQAIRGRWWCRDGCMFFVIEHFRSRLSGRFQQQGKQEYGSEDRRSVEDDDVRTGVCFSSLNIPGADWAAGFTAREGEGGDEIGQPQSFR